MKSILISIKPKYVAKILNGAKTIEIRKTMPKCDLPIDVYVYCTKDKEQLFICKDHRGTTATLLKKDKNTFSQLMANGKVAFKFRCYKVEEIIHWQEKIIYDDEPKPFIYDRYEISEGSIEALANMDFEEVDDYLQGKNGYAIHISDLEIFDKPKELSEFHRCQLLWNCEPYDCNGCRHFLPLTKAPRNMVYIEVE